MRADPPRHPPAPTREQLLHWLHEASEVEHHLMCCYLYAAFSLKREDPRWTDPQRAAVARWYGAILAVAMEEMSHLALVANLVHALGGAAHVGRPAFPVESGPYPADFVIALAPFCAATIEHFKFLERPVSAAIADGPGFEAALRYQRQVPAGRLSPGSQDYSTVGGLYDTLAASLRAAAAQMGEAALFVGDPALQLDAVLAPLPGVAPVTDLASALGAIHTIVAQGEGAPAAHTDSHYQRFCRIADELQQMQAAEPGFEPAWPAATHPVMNAPIKQQAQRVHINHPLFARWLDIGNALYTTSLRCLLQGLVTLDRPAKATWLQVSFALMRAIVPVGRGLAARPAQAGAERPHGGLSFTPLRALAVLPAGQAAVVVAERLDQLRQRAEELPLEVVAGESAARWHEVIALLGEQRQRLAALVPAPQAAVAPVIHAASHHAAPAPGVPPAAPPALDLPPAAPPAPDLPPVAPPAVETVPGRHLDIVYDGRRCIHARHCVLDTPGVFKANTPGAWIEPDAAPAEAVVRVAHACPSGAIGYRRHDGGAQEAAPAVNVLRVRENGPYAVHAALRLAGQDDAYRATLCRCGQSANKPWCDGRHADHGFTATGEPASQAGPALAERGGVLAITPLRDGPLQVTGNLELCAGTGRTVARLTSTRLCRCGQSRNKPYCDLAHGAVGFRADGA